MESIGISQVWRLLRWLPKFILRRIFTKKRLAELVYLDVRPRHNSVSINVIESGEYHIYFQVINLTPFKIELDRADVNFNCGGVKFNKQFIKITPYNSGQIGEFYVNGKVSGSEADLIALNYPDSLHSFILLDCYFNCDLHNFQINYVRLEGINAQYSNAAKRKARLETKL